MAKWTPKHSEKLAFGAMRLTAAFVAGVLFFIVGFIAYKGLGAALRPSFWLDFPQDALRSGGIFPALIGTLCLTATAMAAAAAIGIPAGVYFAEYAPETRLKRWMDVTTNNLAGIPSIVFGLFGMSFFVVGLGFGDSILAGGLTLALMVLPVVIRTTEQAFRDVPNEMRVAGLGLGATRFQTLVRVVAPMAAPRILTGVILSLGRVAGETAPIMFTAAALYLPVLPQSIFDPVMALPYHLYVLSVSSPDPEKSLPAAFGAALALLIIVAALNAAAGFLRLRLERRLKG
ncbi:MAG: phosphate ABC transporter permease PstA [Bacteroidia bacterium]|nr:phosphate ABC transporter permease PstA [Bacteroidia bacterium]MDW8333128.1 phosphate ABC transporter permease PstA [Bacteroidia bacterium]